MTVDYHDDAWADAGDAWRDAGADRAEDAAVDAAIDAAHERALDRDRLAERRSIYLSDIAQQRREQQDYQAGKGWADA